MKPALALLLSATPALAHPGAHVHPQEAAPWVMILAFAILLAGATLGLLVRR